MSPFRIVKRERPLPKNTIELFHQLGKLERLGLQQGESLKAYEENRESFHDFAIEMPAGEGKTLVGGLIAEFNRLVKGWRVVYACATRQLAAQTHGLLTSYGIHAVLLTGEGKLFPESELNKYRRSEAICVTTYNHIFNIRPRFDDAHLLIFDDAHAAETAINNFWSVEVMKRDNEELFEELFGIVKDFIPPHVRDKVQSGAYDPLTDAVDIVPFPLWNARMDDIRSLLDFRTDDTDLFFPWSRIREHLSACQIYVSHYTIVIRPVLPPNHLHVPFVGAQERIFMSATIGEAGELERLFDVTPICRISRFPPGSSKVSGRRLILFPEDHFDRDEIWDVLAASMRLQPRVLIQCPSDFVLRHVLEKLKEYVPEYKVFFARDVEESLQPFLSSSHGVLLLAGRYEGIDLKDEDCRLQIIYELPVAVGLPELFLQSRLRATDVLRSRMVTRVTQALGRCTRGMSDYAAVLFVGRRVGEFINKNEFRQQLPAEIDSEIQLGFDQVVESIDEWQGLLKDFWAQGEEWEPAERHIRQLIEAEGGKRQMPQGTVALAAAGPHELDFVHELMTGDYETAHAAANQVLSQLAHKQGLEGYRAWWNYLIAGVGALQGEEAKVRRHLENAYTASPNKTWLDRRLLQFTVSETETVYPDTIEAQVENILAILDEYGDRDIKLRKDWDSVIRGLSNTNANQFEPALRDFGRYVGLAAERPNGNGDPDGIWDHWSTWFVFEAKTKMQNPESGLSLEDLRQASTHYKWMRKYRGISPETTDVFVIVVSSRKYVEPDAAHAVEGLFIIPQDEIVSVASEFGGILTEALNKMRYSSYEEARKFLGEALMEQGFRMKTLKEKLTANKIEDLPVGRVDSHE
jgi:hypothetical protein